MQVETAPHSPLPVVIDTDPGIDDMLALLLALASPEIEVRGITVSYGNTVVENAYRNTVEIMQNGQSLLKAQDAAGSCTSRWLEAGQH